MPKLLAAALLTAFVAAIAVEAYAQSTSDGSSAPTIEQSKSKKKSRGSRSTGGSGSGE